MTRKTITAGKWSELSSSTALIQNLGGQYQFIVVSDTAPTDGEYSGIKLNPSSTKAFFVETDEKIYGICEYPSDAEVTEVVPVFGNDGTTARALSLDSSGKSKISGGQINNHESVDLSALDYTPATTLNGIFIGTGGDVKLDVEGSENTVTYKNLPDGSFFPADITKVYKTDTTASDIVAYWS